MASCYERAWGGRTCPGVLIVAGPPFLSEKCSFLAALTYLSFSHCAISGRVWIWTTPKLRFQPSWLGSLAMRRKETGFGELQSSVRFRRIVLGALGEGSSMDAVEKHERVRQRRKAKNENQRKKELHLWVRGQLGE